MTVYLWARRFSSQVELMCRAKASNIFLSHVCFAGVSGSVSERVVM